MQYTDIKWWFTFSIQFVSLFTLIQLSNFCKWPTQYESLSSSFFFFMPLQNQKGHHCVYFFARKAVVGCRKCLFFRQESCSGLQEVPLKWWLLWSFIFCHITNVLISDLKNSWFYLMMCEFNISQPSSLFEVILSLFL